MYNEEKKLITDIERGKDLDKNLVCFADAVFKADFEYACHKFTLNYLTLMDMHLEGDEPKDSYIKHCQSVLDSLISKYIAGSTDTVDEADISSIREVRAAITGKMRVLTAYTDAFETYEYILNRKEYQFDENMTDALREELSAIDPAVFADEVFKFVFADSDKVAINSKLQSIIGQIPVRMTKNRFYDILGDTLDIYKGVEKESLDQFIEMVEGTALIRLPEGFETEYPELFEALSILKNGEYTELTYEKYMELSAVLDKSADFLNSVVTEYMLIIELVNDLYAMLLAISSKDKVSDSCNTAISVIGKAASGADGELEDAFMLIETIVGEQELAGEHKLMLESAIYEITNSYGEEIAANGLEESYRKLEVTDKLLSGSMFVDIDSVAMAAVLTVESDYIAACKEMLADKFAKLFEDNSMTVNRAIMAKILSNIPVFFNTTDEIKEYITGSLTRCRESSELLADYIVIKQMMEE